MKIQTAIPPSRPAVWLLGLLLVLTAIPSKAQVNLRLLHVRPWSHMGFLFKPSFGVEAGYMQSFENDRLRFCGTLSYVPLKARLDTFPTVQVILTQKPTVYPGWAVYDKVGMLQASAGIDYAFLQQDQLSLFVGAEVTIGIFRMQYRSVTPGLGDEDSSQGQFMAGLKPRVGIDYMVNERIGLYATSGRAYMLVNEEALLNAFEFGLGAHFQIR